MTRKRRAGTPAPFPRLVDLDIPWLWQYAPETTLFDASFGAAIIPRLGQLAGYLDGTALALVSLSLDSLGPELRTEPWRAWSEQLSRVEAEFCGRILATHDDLGRWDADTDGLCWAVARIEGLSDAIHHAEELDCVRLIINRGVRVFAWSRAGAAAPGGALEHRLTLGVLLDWLDQERRAEGAPTAIDLAHTRLMERLAALEWFEAEPGRAAGVLPVVRYPLDQRDPSAPMSSEEVRRWRALGAFVGFALVGPEPQAPEALRDAIRSITRLPWNGNPEPGCEGLALSTGFLREGHTITGLGDVESIGRWLLEAFGPPDGRWLACETGRTLVRRIFTKP